MTTENTETQVTADPEVDKLRGEVSSLRYQLNKSETDAETKRHLQAQLETAIKRLQERLDE